MSYPVVLSTRKEFVIEHRHGGSNRQDLESRRRKLYRNSDFKNKIYKLRAERHYMHHLPVSVTNDEVRILENKALGLPDCCNEPDSLYYEWRVQDLF